MWNEKPMSAKVSRSAQILPLSSLQSYVFFCRWANNPWSLPLKDHCTRDKCAMVLTIYGSCASSFGGYWVFVSIYHLITQEKSIAPSTSSTWVQLLRTRSCFIAIVHEPRWKDYAEMMLFAKLQIITFPLSALPINRGYGFPFQIVIPLINSEGTAGILSWVSWVEVFGSCIRHHC